MNKIDKLSLKYFIFAIPFILFLLIWGATDSPQELSLLTEGWKHYFWDSLGWVFMIWILVALYLLAKLVFSTEFRISLFSNISSIKERDERESQITGDAAKFSMLSTLALLFLFLFLSLFNIKIGKYPDSLPVADGKRGYVTMGANFYPFEQKQKEIEVKEDGQEIFTYSGVPISNSMLILLLIFWNLGLYHLKVRRSQKN